MGGDLLQNESLAAGGYGSQQSLHIDWKHQEYLM